ncbi:hypothetical protein LWX53_03250 [bacterium]|nr:hypothetical protein [bacterium]
MPRMQAPEKRAAESGGRNRPSPLARDVPPAKDALRALAPRKLILRALALGAAGSAAAWLVGIDLLGRPYYFAWAIVAAMGLYLLLAWLLYLRDDAFMSRPRQPGAGRSDPPPAPKALRGSVRVLLMAAAMLAALSLVLYFCFGIGAAP